MTFGKQHYPFFFLFFNPQNVRRYIWHREVVDYNPVVCFTVGYDASSFTGLSEFSPEKCGSDEKGSWQNKYGWFTENGKYGGTEFTYLECSICTNAFFQFLMSSVSPELKSEWSFLNCISYRNSTITETFCKPKYAEMYHPYYADSLCYVIRKLL